MSADVLAQVETALAKLRRDDFPDREWPLWEELQDALESLRVLRATAVEGFADEVAEHARDCSCSRARTFAVSADCGHIPATRRRALLLLPTPAAGTSPEYEEDA